MILMVCRSPTRSPGPTASSPDCRFRRPVSVGLGRLVAFGSGRRRRHPHPDLHHDSALSRRIRPGRPKLDSSAAPAGPEHLGSRRSSAPGTSGAAVARFAAVAHDRATDATSAAYPSMMTSSVAVMAFPHGLGQCAPDPADCRRPSKDPAVPLETISDPRKSRVVHAFHLLQDRVPFLCLDELVGLQMLRRPRSLSHPPGCIGKGPRPGIEKIHHRRTPSFSPERRVPCTPTHDCPRKPAPPPWTRPSYSVARLSPWPGRSPHPLQADKPLRVLRRRRRSSPLNAPSDPSIAPARLRLFTTHSTDRPAPTQSAHDVSEEAALAPKIRFAANGAAWARPRLTHSRSSACGRSVARRTANGVAAERQTIQFDIEQEQ